MSVRENEPEEEAPEEEAPEEEPSEEVYLDRVRRLVRSQPDVIFVIVQELLDLLIATNTIKAEDVEVLIRAGVNRWVSSQRE